MTAQETLQVRVVKKQAEAEGITSCELARLDGAALPPFSAGSHIDVHLPGGQSGGLVRQYSLCNASHESHRYRIAVLRDPASRGGSVAMHDSVHEGDVITISTPRNHFALHPAQRTLLLAGEAMRRISEASASLRERGGLSSIRAVSTRGRPGLVISIRSSKISTMGPLPVMEKS